MRARLGEPSVRALAMVADYRPECATREQDPLRDTRRSAAGDAPPDRPRPLWLLPHPQPLHESRGGPLWHGPLRLVSPPERLESGWWDAGERQATGDVRRDYFVARNPLGQWVWIFRSAEGWFLHGLFA